MREASEDEQEEDFIPIPNKCGSGGTNERKSRKEREAQLRMMMEEEGKSRIA